MTAALQQQSTPINIVHLAGGQYLPEGRVLDGQFVASDPLVALWIKLLDPVSGDGTAAVLIGLEPGQSHGVPGDVGGSDSGWRTRRF